MDIDAAGTMLPNAVLRFTDKPDTSLQYVPTVFITQRAIAALQRTDTTVLAQKIITLIASLDSMAGIIPEEIQMDCDWTVKSKEAYFAVLRVLRQQPFMQHKKLSCTLRLHQTKYSGTSGIPPVDRAMLMCYTMGNIKNPEDHNSILDADLAKEYLGSIKHYPLPLDIALPIFQWSVLFRNNQFNGILRDMDPVTFKANVYFSKHGNVYTCLKDTQINHYLIHEHDKIRVEMPGKDEISRMAKFAASQDSAREISIAFFHLDSLNLSKYPPHELETILNSFR